MPYIHITQKVQKLDPRSDLRSKNLVVTLLGSRVLPCYIDSRDSPLYTACLRYQLYISRDMYFYLELFPVVCLERINANQIFKFGLD